MSETHLYRAEHIDSPGIYEDAFSRLEAAAAPVLAKFRDPDRPKLTPEDFEAWATFVLAQRSRVPARIAWAKEQAIAAFTATFTDNDPDFELFRREEWFSTPLKYIQDYHPNVLANFRGGLGNSDSPIGGFSA